MAFALLKPAECVDCGSGGVPHGFTYFTIALDNTVWKFFPPSDKQSFIKRTANSFEHAIGPAILIGFVKLGLAKKVTEPDDETLLLALMLWNEANVRGIDMWEWRLFGLARNAFVATFPNGKTIAFEGIPEVPSMQPHVWWMDDKARLKEEFTKRGLAVAKGGAATNEKEALTIYRNIIPPVIVKPASGSGSRHTILHIVDEKELARAFHVAKQISPVVIVEEELVGPVYRATVVNGKFIASLRRDPPSVLADGIHTVAELVEEENKNPGRQGPYFSHIQLFDAEGNINKVAEEELKWQKYDVKSIPEKGTRVYFHQKVNWSVGGTTADVTAETHSDNIALFEKAAKELTAPIVGLDFIIKDISKSWKEQPRSGILECNSMPFFDNHHLPYEGEPHNVAAAIWDMVTSKG
jgi:D-alanine-D-alanine ligase-like ATP-grasp enzyme